MASGGLLSTDSSNPRLCITGEIVNDAEILMDQIDCKFTLSLTGICHLWQ